MNIVAALCRNGRQYGQKIALIQGERTMTYAAFITRVEKAAERLGRLGFSGAHVALRVGNSIDDLILALAVILSGHALVAIPPESTEAEVREHLCCCNAAVLLHASGESWTVAQVPGAETPAMQGIAFIRPTSGTTGRSKGVMLSHQCMTARIASTCSMLGLRPEDRIFWTLPIHLHFASSILLYLRAGATIALSEFSSAEQVLPAIHRHQSTILYGSPWQFRCLAGDMAALGMPSVRLAISTGQHVPGQTAERFEQRFGLPLRQAYGVIEAGLVCVNVAQPPDAPDSVGHVAPGVGVTVTDDDGRAVPEGHIGEIRITGETLFAGYVHPGDGAGRIDGAGAFLSGDMGSLQGGIVTLQGRRSSMINVAGFKVFPEEVENVLDGHPAVHRSRVYGVSDARMGQIVAADVMYASGRELPSSELIRYCRQCLSPYKIPLRVTPVRQIPVTVSGKIQRYV